MSMIRWLHFSDLHFNKNGVETRLLRKQLPEYLRRMNVRCDYAFCTGDLRYAPSGSFTEDTVQQIKSICGAVQVPTERLFLVPGNHDIDRTAPGRDEAVRRVFYANGPVGSRGYYSPEVGTVSPTDLSVIAGGKTEYNALLNVLYADVPGRAERYADAGHPHFVVPTEHLNIVHLDSTLTYFGDQQRDLIVGTELLMDALETLDKSKPTVLLTHYSFDFLHRSEQRGLDQLLREYHVQLWLAGHEHDHLCRRQWDCFYEFQCGNLVLEDGALSCVLLGSLDPDTGKGQISAHAWFPKRGWAEYPILHSGAGERKIYPFQITAPAGAPHTPADPLEANALASCEELTMAGSPFHQVEIRPALMPDLQWGQQIFTNSFDGQPPLVSALDALWKNRHTTGEACHALLLGDGGMGKSTMLFHLCRQLIQERHIPTVFVSLQALQGIGIGIEQHILRVLYQAEGESSRNGLLRLLHKAEEQPALVLLVDGFNELRGDAAYRYASELKRLSQTPGIQIIVSSRLDFLRSYGMAHFQMLRTCALRDEQIKTLFTAEEWPNILAKRHLHILLQNPMMALLYARTYPLIERYRDLPFCDWQLPISNATDLLHDYYLAQAAILVDRTNGDGMDILIGFFAVRYILPFLAFKAERSNAMGWPDTDLARLVGSALQENAGLLQDSALPPALERLKRMYRLRLNQPISGGDVADSLLSELCLLREGNGMIFFTHQIYRDYLAAVYLYDQSVNVGSASEVWRERSFPAGIIQYLRYMHGDLWGENGDMARLLAPYRGRELADADHCVENLIHCWLQEDADLEVTRDLSGLDLREISLAEHLKRSYKGSILLDGAKVSRKTFVSEQRHDRIVSLAFSHDRQLLAAISINGIVSVSSILTQSQMIIGSFPRDGNAAVCFTAEDCLALKTGGGVFLWPTVAFDKVEAADSGSLVFAPQEPIRPDCKAGQLWKMLDDSGLLGTAQSVSDDQQLLAVGHANGLLQVWDAQKQSCMAEFSLGDSQVITASFSPMGSYAALCAGGTLVQLWNVAKKQCLQVRHFDRPIRRVRFPSARQVGAELTLECECSDGTCFRWALQTGEIRESRKSQRLLQIQRMLRNKLKGKSIQKIDVADNGNAVIMFKNSKELMVWNDATHRLNTCRGHEAPIRDAAICRSDPRYAASYSDERLRVRNKGDRPLSGQKVIRTWALRLGNCMHRLSTDQHAIKRIQFFTTNRILLAGFATNGDILLWEYNIWLANGEERGHWDRIDTVRSGPADPLECAVSTKDGLFMGIYTDGTLFSRNFSGSRKTSFTVFPGIDPTSLVWEDLCCEDEIKRILRLYR